MEYQKPEYSMSFDDDQGQVHTSADTDLQALTKKVLSSMNPAPVIGDLPDTYVKLPCGIVTDNGVVRDAEVQELTGEHEEKIAKVFMANNPAKYIKTILQCGTVSIGDKPVTSAILDQLLHGDLDMLMLSIRKATFGEEFEVFNVICPHCQELNDLTMNLKDIPVVEMEDPEVREFFVPLRKNRKAKISLPNGALQDALYKTEQTVAEMNSTTLAACVISIIEADGTEIMSTGLASVKKLGIMDRKMIQDYIYNNQPGPRYDKVFAACHACEGEVPVPLNVGILFREI